MHSGAIAIAFFNLLITATIMAAHVRTSGRITLLAWGLLALGGVYGIAWPIVLVATHLGHNPSWHHLIAQTDDYLFLYGLSVQILLIGIISGWFFLSWRFPTPADARSRMPIAHETYWGAVFWIFFIASVIFQAIYASAYGGLFALLEYSVYIRSGAFDALPPNSFSFLKPFGAFSIIATVGFFGLRLDRRRNTSIHLGFWLSFIFSTYILVSWLGRLGLLTFLATFPVAWASHKVRSPLIQLLVFSAIFALIIIAVYIVSVAANLKTASSLLAFFARELSFPYASFCAQLANGKYLFLGFKEFFLTPAFLLPSSIWSSWIQPIGQINTLVIIGAQKGASGNTTNVPVDLLTLGLMQFHIAGVYVVGAFYGLTLYCISYLLRKLRTHGVRVAIEAHIGLVIAAIGMFYAQPSLFIINNIHWVIFALCCLTVALLARIFTFKRNA